MSRGPAPLGFRLLLRLLPREFRRRYAADMAATFADRRAEARAAGHGASLRLWGRTLLDVTRTAAAERRRSSLRPVPAGGSGARPRSSAVPGFVHGVGDDVRVAFRVLRRQPGYAAFVVFTLAVGLGATTAVFSVVDGVLLRPLPFANPDRVVGIWGRFLPESGFDFARFSLSGPEYLDYRATATQVEGVAAWARSTVTLAVGEADPERVPAASIAPALLDTLGVSLANGRSFRPDEGAPGGARVVILGHAFWRDHFGGAADTVGRTVLINGRSTTIVGIAPAGFEFANADLWLPLVIDPANPGGRAAHGIFAIGRLAPGATLESASAEMSVLMDGWKRAYPEVHTGHFLYLSPILDDLVGNVRPMLLALLGATGLVLLIVCANVSSLVLARGELRLPEMAIRRALGAGRARVMRLVLVECLLLSTAGGVIAVGLAAVGLRAVRALDQVGLPRLESVAIDWRVLAFAFAATLVAALAVGLVPAVRGTAAQATAGTGAGDRAPTAGRSRLRFRRGLVAGEVALTLVLVIGAGLMLRSLQQLRHVDPGFDAHDVLLASLSLPAATYDTDARVRAFYRDLVARLDALPGVVRASASTAVPLYSGTGLWDFELDGEPAPGPGQPAWNAATGFVLPGFLETMRIPVVRGRSIEAADTATAEPVVLVNEALVRKFFHGRDPIGRRLRIETNDGSLPWMTIVGIVGDYRDQAVQTPAQPMYFIPYVQGERSAAFTSRYLTIVIRGTGDAAATASGLRQVVRDADRGLALYSVASFPETRRESLARDRFATSLFATFAAIGLVLGATGIYGVIAYTVARRTREIGIRRALGASSRAVLALVLRQGLVPVAAGTLAGLAAAWYASRAIAAQLFNVSPTDAATYAGVAGMVLIVSVVACLVPARRALRIAASMALRES